MNILFITNGEPKQRRPRDIIKKVIPDLADQLKNFASLVLPKAILRLVLSGFGTGEKRFPLGLGYLSAMLKLGGHTVSLVDRFADPNDWPDDIHSTDFVGVYTSTPCYEDALRVLKHLEAEGYGGPVAFGGPHATALPETIPPRVNYIVQGEAEYIINDLVHGKYPSGVTLRTQRIKDLDALPRADYDLFTDKARSYRFTIPYSDVTPIFNMNTSRSCPLSCSFCTVRKIWGRLWRAQSAQRIFDDILWLKRKYGIGGVYFREDFFSASESRVFELCELLIKNKTNIVWACEIRADTACDENMVNLMARSGCKGFYIGAESGSQRMLNYYTKKITVDQIVRASLLAKKYHIAVAMSLIVANPEETQKDRFKTWNMVRQTRPEILYVNAYRDEVSRHGSVNFPTYPSRETINISYDNGTWLGQNQRMRTKSMPADPIALQSKEKC
jgi:radical SAM superfamily enzyme YgiQ (UPF0313 family)